MWGTVFPTSYFQSIVAPAPPEFISYEKLVRLVPVTVLAHKIWGARPHGERGSASHGAVGHGAEPPAESRGRAPGGGSGDKAL